MKQLTQKLRDGLMEVKDVPLPALGPGQILVRNHYSLISAGTEGGTVRTARKGLIGKAKERPQQVKQVLDVLMTQGPVQTYRAVMKKLDAYSPLGYSCTGRVIAVGPGVTSFKVGDLVACGGLTACHAEVVAVPVNLCVQLNEGADLRQAAYNTLGAIAMQGIRQADLRLGETCAVIGLGLLGQLTGLLLKASGVRVVGVDVNPAMVEMARTHSTDIALARSDDGVEQAVSRFTRGVGCDAVIITAASDSLDPINFAGAIARKRGVIVVVGAVPTGFDRDPHYYRKELQVRMSCSYGPGRYDPIYEDKGQDYPVAYVRWTENRNMQAFQALIETGKIDLSFLTTHVFRLEDAPKAYDMIIQRSEPSVGILIEYDLEKSQEPVPGGVLLGASRTAAGIKPDQVRIGFIGAGSYAQSHLLPNLPKTGDVVLKGVMTATSASARSAGERYGFEFCTGNPDDILGHDDINTVFIATRHDSHGEFVKKALLAGKHVFVEKPLCLTADELEEIRTIYRTIVADQGAAPLLMVGYNRRFSPFVDQIKKEVSLGPLAATYRINAGAVPQDSWIQDPDMGGGRIIGEVCHFVDTLYYLAGSPPASLWAAAMDDAPALLDTLNVSLRFQNGSIAAIAYYANGDKGLPKERLEVFANGCSMIVDDYRKLTVHSHGKKREQKRLSQDKGQKQEVRAFIDAVLKGEGSPIPFEEIYNVSHVAFKIVESIQTQARMDFQS